MNISVLWVYKSVQRRFAYCRCQKSPTRNHISGNVVYVINVLEMLSSTFIYISAIIWSNRLANLVRNNNTQENFINRGCFMFRADCDILYNRERNLEKNLVAKRILGKRDIAPFVVFTLFQTKSNLSNSCFDKYLPSFSSRTVAPWLSFIGSSLHNRRSQSQSTTLYVQHKVTGFVVSSRSRWTTGQQTRGDRAHKMRNKILLPSFLSILTIDWFRNSWSSVKYDIYPE